MISITSGYMQTRLSVAIPVKGILYDFDYFRIHVDLLECGYSCEGDFA